MKKTFLSLPALICALLVLALLPACHSSAPVAGNGTIDAEAAKWFGDRAWLNGLALTPHSSINKAEFYRQYKQENRYWDEAFAYLKNQDLPNLPPGTYVIDSGNVVATVTRHVPKQRDDVNWEGHRNFNDLQYIISGKTQMGVASIADPGTDEKTPYDPKADVAVFSVSNGRYYDAVPGTFFIFSPRDIHRPAFRAAGADTIKKIVIKVRVPGTR